MQSFKPVDVSVPLIRIALAVDLEKAYSVYELESATDLSTDRIRNALKAHNVPSRKQARPAHDFSAETYREHMDVEIDASVIRCVRVWKGQDIVLAARYYLDRVLPKPKKKRVR